MASAQHPTTYQGITGNSGDISIGTMSVKAPVMSVMLVFSREDDEQCRTLHRAAESRGYPCHVVHNAESVVDLYLHHHHHVIYIDQRHRRGFDAEALCRSIRATDRRRQTVIIAVTDKPSADREEASIIPLLKAGFNRRMIETTSLVECTNELVTVEMNDVHYRCQHQASQALWTALEHSNDAVEILNDKQHIQYINPAHERLLGYTIDEHAGQNAHQLYTTSDKNSQDQHDAIQSYIAKGKIWEGITHVKKKTGETMANHCKVIPVTNASGLRHVVVLRGTQETDRYNLQEITQLAGVAGFPRRRESIAKIHSMTIEAPITKVINMINAAQENSSSTVATALDTVLEILKSSELYSPYLGGQQVKQDQMTSELVDGLMQGMRRRQSSLDTNSLHKASSSTPVLSPSFSLTHNVPPNVHSLLLQDQDWNFPILELETITHKRPLLHLGMQIFRRFGVGEMLEVSDACLHSWLQMVETNYHSKNYYHNSTHAADVLHATAYFLEKHRPKSLLSRWDQTSALLAAVIHDIDHPGFTNAYLINADNQLAMLYNDVAVLESHHISLAFHLTAKHESSNILKNLSRENYREVRTQMIDMVLATEMTKHFEHLNKFIGSVTKTILRPKDDGSSVLMNGLSSRASSPASLIEDLATEENRILIKRMLIKCADVANPLRELGLCKDWAVRIAREYCGQTDEERKRGLPVVMPTFDRETCNLPRTQIGFIDLFIDSMFREWDTFCEIPELIAQLESNYEYWKSQDLEGTAMLDELAAQADRESNT